FTLFFSLILLAPRSTLFPYTTLFRSRAQYNLMCKEDGGVIDDLVVYRSAPSDFLVVVNASNREKDVEWLRHHLPDDVSMTDKTRSEEHTSELQSRGHLVCRLLLEKKK